MRNIVKQMNQIEQKIERRYNKLFKVEEQILQLQKKRGKLGKEISRLESAIGKLATRARDSIHARKA